jgi:hypothetical protein
MKKYSVFAGIEYRNYENRVDMQDYAVLTVEADTIAGALVAARERLKGNPMGDRVILYRVEHTRAWGIADGTITEVDLSD